MQRPWMPLYVGDFIADTMHLSTPEIGAYFFLIMHYWRSGGLPDNDLALSRITRLDLQDWLSMRPVLEAFFQPGWKHKRIEFELTEAARISEAGRKGGIASGQKRREKSITSNDRSTTVQRLTNDSPTIGQALHSPSQSKKENGSAMKASSLAEKSAGQINGRHYARPESKQWRAWDDYLKSQGKSAQRDRDGGWWFASEWPPSLPQHALAKPQRGA